MGARRRGTGRRHPRDRTLEIGPGYGAFLRVLIDKTPQLTSVEIDTPMAQLLQRRYGERARIINGDGTDSGLPADEFSSVVCFTMLHHVPTAELQDRLFAEAFRVLRPGGVFANSDGVPSLPFRILHFRDTCNPVPPETLPDRLRAAGFHDVDVEVGPADSAGARSNPSRESATTDGASRERCCQLHFRAQRDIPRLIVCDGPALR